MYGTRKIEIGFFLLLSTGTLIASFFVLKPYLSALFVALVFAVVFRPLHVYLERAISGRNISALATLLLLFLLLLIPAAIFGFFVFDDAQTLYVSIMSGETILPKLAQSLAPLEARLESIIPSVSFDIASYVTEGLSFLVGNFGVIFSRTVSLIFNTGIMLLALFYLFRDGAKFRSFIIRLSPLTNEYDERILVRIEEAVSSVVKGRLLIVFIQGLLAAIGFFLFGIPHAVLLGALVMIAALVPAIGVALVFAPAVLYLFFVGSEWIAVGLLVCGIIVGTIDNVLAPIFLERGLRMHPLLILLSVLGGLALFGPVGFLAGPVTLAFLFALFDIYPLLFQDSGNQQ